MTIQLFRKAKKTIYHNAKEDAYQLGKTLSIFENETFGKLSYLIFSQNIVILHIVIFQTFSKICHILIVI